MILAMNFSHVAQLWVFCWEWGWMFDALKMSFYNKLGTIFLIGWILVLENYMWTKRSSKVDYIQESVTKTWASSCERTFQAYFCGFQGPYIVLHYNFRVDQKKFCYYLKIVLRVAPKKIFLGATQRIVFWGLAWKLFVTILQISEKHTIDHCWLNFDEYLALNFVNLVWWTTWLSYVFLVHNLTFLEVQHGSSKDM